MFSTARLGSGITKKGVGMLSPEDENRIADQIRSFTDIIEQNVNALEEATANITERLTAMENSINRISRIQQRMEDVVDRTRLDTPHYVELDN